MKNKMEIKIPSLSRNECLARNMVALFAVELNPSLEKLSDIKTAVSEAVTNCIVHGYPDEVGEIEILVMNDNGVLHIEVMDRGVGITDIEKAKQPFFTTKTSEDRSGMGFTVMETFMDSLDVENREGGGLRVVMRKSFVGNLQEN